MLISLSIYGFGLQSTMNRQSNATMGRSTPLETISPSAYRHTPHWDTSESKYYQYYGQEGPDLLAPNHSFWLSRRGREREKEVRVFL
jgi:hypothetical protein